MLSIAETSASVVLLPKEIEAAIHLIIRKDGDRDHMNHSDLTCEESMAVCHLLRRALVQLEE